MESGSTAVLRHLRGIISSPEYPLAGQSLGPYDLVAEIGRGAMGAVFRAIDRRLGRTVALKVSLAELTAESERRFASEARAAALLQHPNAAQVYEAGTADGWPYIAMEYVEGDTLKRLRLEHAKVAELVADAADAVQSAHEKGIVHRDIKPQNMMLDRNGRVRVMDFGLARMAEGEATLTRPGSVIGTPAYMAPECAGAGRGDERSDIYSLGATLYDLLTGRPPFEGGSALQVLDRVRTSEPIPPRKLDARIPRELETVVLKAMDRTPARRYANARSLAEDLRRHLRNEPILAKPTGPILRAVKWAHRHRRTSVTAAALAAAALLATGEAVRREADVRGQVRTALDEATRADREGRFGDARLLCARAKALAPDEAAVERRYAAAEAAERRAAAERFMREGRRAMGERDGLEQELATLVREGRELAESVAPDAGPDAKRRMWEVERRIEETRRASGDRLTDAVTAFTSAAAIDAGHREARAALAALHFADFERAELRGDREAMIVSERMARAYDDGALAGRFAREGTLELSTAPSGAEAFLFRYEEGSDRRLLPLPYRAGTREVRRRDSETRAGRTAYPLDVSEFNRLGTTPLAAFTLPSGRYLVVVRHEGCRDTRYPMLVGRGTRQSAAVTLYADAEIGAEFVHVPGGTFVSGGDSGAQDGGPRAEPEVRDFFIGRHEVTMGEYTAFLNDLLARGRVDEARKRLIRIGPNGFVGPVPTAEGPPLECAHPDWPAFGVSWDDADAYCRWLTVRARASGDLVSFRLPTVAEWEKAARGVDGRAFPWGDQFDWTFTKGWWSGDRPDGIPRLEAVGAIAADESPYGVRDLAGSLREWCLDAVEDHFRRECGGSWGDRIVSHFHAAARYWAGATTTAANTGFRIVRELEK